MAKKGAFLLFLLFCSLAYAEIDGSIKLGETKYYITPSLNVSISFNRQDLLTQRAAFVINGRQHSLLALQQKRISDLTFIFTGFKGSSFNDTAASFVILGNSPFECERICEDNNLVDFIRAFDPDFSLCKKDCKTGCGLYKEIKCLNNDEWLFDNCDTALDLAEACTGSCISSQCADCGDNKCVYPENFFNCEDCTDRPDFCISGMDCLSSKCINGRCSQENYIIGDGICSLPEEPCSSTDCSCNNEESIPASKNDYPIVIFHGFASSSLKFRKLQRDLAYYLGYENAGFVSLSDISCPTNEKKAVYIGTYYEDKAADAKKQDGLTKFIRDSFYKIIGEEQPGKPTFVDTFSRVIEKVKSCSDSDKVNVISHSMGSLVTRKYLISGSNIKNIGKVILIASPNHGGIYGSHSYEMFSGLKVPLGDNKDLLKKCSTIGAPSVVLSLIDGRDVTGECQELQSTGDISDPILDIDETPGIVEYYTIAGNVDGKGDSIVPAESAALDGAVFNKVVACNHFDIKDPSKCRDSFNAIIDALGYDKSSIRKNTISHMADEFISVFADFFSGFSD